MERHPVEVTTFGRKIALCVGLNLRNYFFWDAADTSFEMNTLPPRLPPLVSIHLIPFYIQLAIFVHTSSPPQLTRLGKLVISDS